MSQAIEINAQPDITTVATGPLKRSAVLLYGVAAYAIGVGGLLWIILAMGGLAPVGISQLQTDSLPAALALDLGLIALFGLQHSIMARRAFKQRLKAWLPEAAERATFVLLSGVCLGLALWAWQPLPGTLWQVESTTAQYLLWGLYALGWSYLFIATFVTNHFELMGLRQVYLYFCERPYTKLPFVKKYMYRYSRHPMMLGVLVGMWAVPTMSVSHFVMASLLSAYIVVGVFFEERDLVKQFGDTYRRYRKEIAAIIPGMF